MDKNKNKKQEAAIKEEEKSSFVKGIIFTQKMALQIADEVVKRITFQKKKKPAAARLSLLNALFLDTSAIIDSRIFDLLHLNVFFGNLVIIESVLSELKNLADSKDSVKKERGRRALELLEELKKEKKLLAGRQGIRLNILKDKEYKLPVDDKIVELAKKHRGRIVTCDFNLTKKASIAGVIAIDIYEVANALKVQAIPGDTFFLKIMQKGKGENQGVGYLPDGTMVVIEKGEEFLDKTAKVAVTKILQTDAGRMLFGKIIG